MPSSMSEFSNWQHMLSLPIVTLTGDPRGRGPTFLRRTAARRRTILTFTTTPPAPSTTNSFALQKAGASRSAAFKSTSAILCRLQRLASVTIWCSGSSTRGAEVLPDGCECLEYSEGSSYEGGERHPADRTERMLNPGDSCRPMDTGQPH